MICDLVGRGINKRKEGDVMDQNAKDDLVRIGIIGTGVGLRTLYPGFQRVPNARVIALVGSSPERALGFAEKHAIPYTCKDYRELIDRGDIDLVCVASPNVHHYEAVLYALQSGRHVLAEKPLAMTLDETIALRDAARESGKIAIVDHQLRFNPYLQRIRDLILGGNVGRPYFIRVHQQSTGFSDPKATWSWSFDDELGGGVRLAMGSHLIDLLRFWIGSRTIYSVLGNMDVGIAERNDLSGRKREVGVSSFVSALVACEGNMTVSLTATAAALGEARFDVSVYGTEGELHFDLAKKLSGTFASERGKTATIHVDGVTVEEQENKVSIFKGSFVYLAPLLIQAIQTSNLSVLDDASTFEDALQTQVMLDALRKSAASGETIQIESGYACNAHV